jgi:hypothetical protein
MIFITITKADSRALEPGSGRGMASGKARSEEVAPTHTRNLRAIRSRHHLNTYKLRPSGTAVLIRVYYSSVKLVRHWAVAETRPSFGRGRYTPTPRGTPLLGLGGTQDRIGSAGG